ncbi:Protein FAR1-RELATED SEQUENCE [Caenorhabditis elegans]|uniref:Protein FAR1-RELATED SEQUENCE n=1 Tax=Caenorhabditis elegans TaxID=6239 RepID=Q23480_CAEEL|nr:Protein FAR1-RELATED SEQUENCE [Caenorhabditis elegans]CCD69742.2 Protein FAR1-RELATED SEQUENCE [Caenorhabditis elegans]
MKRTSAYHRKAGRHVHMVMNASQTTNQAESDEDGVDSATSLPRSPKRARTEMSSSDDDDDLEIIETVDGYPKPEPVDFDFEELLNRDSTYNLLIDHSQEYKEVMMEENNQPTIYVKSGNIPRKVDKGPSIPRRKPKNSVFKNDKKVPMRDFTTDEEEKTPRCVYCHYHHHSNRCGHTKGTFERKKILDKDNRCHLCLAKREGRHCCT